MKCPIDGTLLQTVNVGNVELDKCHKCDGIWFDYGELEKIIAMGAVQVEEQLETSYGNPEFREGEVEGYMRCPRCGDARLQGFTYTYVRPVRIDRCEKCFGLWLDDTELDAILGEKKALDEVDSQVSLKEFFRSFRHWWAQ